MNFFCFYTSTPGLERFPKLERLGVWISTHKQLLKENAQYRSRVGRTTWRLILAGVVFVILLLACIVAELAVTGRRSNLTLAGCIILLSVVYTLYNTVVSFRLQKFMNENVGKALR